MSPRFLLALALLSGCTLSSDPTPNAAPVTRAVALQTEAALTRTVPDSAETPTTLPPLARLGTEVALLLPGEYHADETEAYTMQPWTGLFYDPDTGTPYAEAVRITVDRVYDQVLDAEGEATGKEVTLHHDREPLALIHGLAIPDGPVPTATDTTHTLFDYDYETLTLTPHNVDMTFGGRTARLGVEPQENEPQVLRLVLTVGEVRQVLGDPFHLGGEGEPVRLLWAGDLDGDGHLDLLLDGLVHHYNAYVSLGLFLSSEATSEHLVAQVAEFTAVGC